VTKKLSTMKGVGPQPDFGGDPLWTAGFVDLYVGQDSRTGWIKKLLGPDAGAFAPMPERCVGCGSGQVFWGNGISLLGGARYPQAATNFIVWAFRPRRFGWDESGHPEEREDARLQRLHRHGAP
jgi:hypothetical protein